MKLSEDLAQCHACGDFGNALEGFAERAEKLERFQHKAWNYDFNLMMRMGFTIEDAKHHANDAMKEMNS